MQLYEAKRKSGIGWVRGYLVRAKDIISDNTLSFIIGDDAIYYGYGEFDCVYEVEPETIKPYVEEK